MTSTTRPNIWQCCNLHHLFYCGMVDNTNKYESAANFFCSCLHMVDDTKSCVGDLLVWGLFRLTPKRQQDAYVFKKWYTYKKRQVWQTTCVFLMFIYKTHGSKGVKGSIKPPLLNHIREVKRNKYTKMHYFLS